MKPLLLTLSVVGLLLLSACGEDLHNHPHLTTGKQLFEHHCAGCHGASGRGRFLLGVPPNRDSGLQEIQIVYRMRHPKGDKMPVFDDMPEAEAVSIANYLSHME